MATTQKPNATTNGAANSNSAKPASITTATPPAAETATSRNEAREEPKTGNNIAQRLERFHQLEKLKERRDTVQDALDDLENFHIAPTGGANLQLQDSKRNTFAIAHPVVIGEIVALAKKKLQEELNAIDAQFIL